MNYRIIFILNVMLFLLFLPQEAYGTYSEEQLSELSLQDLMDIEVSFGTFTGIEQAKFPGNITIITREDIALTPARNILDLIEIYVPGATYVTHFQGQRLGMRGILSDQNYSYQLLVNGKNMNLKSSYGPMFEIQDKDLSSIEKIEIISGSGSAIYGPGAIAGIINIITKKPKDKYLTFGMQNNLQYRYQNRNIEFYDTWKKLQVYFNASISESDGLENTKFWYVDRAHHLADNQPYGWGYMSPHWGNYGYGNDAPAMYDDYNDTPEVKIHLDLEWGDNLRLWSRYSTYNHTLVTPKRVAAEGAVFAGQLAKYFSTELSYNSNLGNKINWVNKLGFDSANIRHINLYQGAGELFDHISQRGNSYSENEVIYHSLFNYSLNEKYKFALGGEVCYEYYSPEWGMDDESFILSMQAPIRFAVLNNSSDFYEYYGESIATVIDEEIDGTMYSIFGEANLDFHKRFRTLASMRVDKHEFSDIAYSPRLALISEISDKNVLTFMLSRSVRMPAFTDLFAQDYLGGENAKPEIVNSSEFIISHQPNPNLNIKFDAYYYTVDQISWIGEEHYSDFIGTFNLLGIEPEIRYQNERLALGGNYSFIKQLDWEPEIETEAWISGLAGEQIFLDDYGSNRINNLPKHALKAFGNYKLSSNIKFHFDGRLMWDFQQKEMLDKFLEAHEEYGNEDTLEAMKQIYQDLEDHGYTKPSFTSNFAVNWKVVPEKYNINLKLYAMNLISYNHIRYVIQFWEGGNVRQYPRQSGFIDEPLSVGINVEIQL